MKKNIVSWALALSCMLVLAGCGQETPVDGTEEAVEEGVPTGYAPVAEFTMLPIPETNYVGEGHGDCFYADGEIIYLEQEDEMDEETGIYHYYSHLWAVPADGSGEPRAVAEDRKDSAYINRFFMDKGNNLYLLEASGERIWGPEAAYYLRKINADGQEAYLSDLTGLMADLDVDFLNLEGYADREGNVALLSPWSDKILFFDSEGQYQGAAGMPDNSLETHNGTNHMVYGGGKYYLWDYAAFEDAITIREVDFGKRLVSDGTRVSTSFRGKQASRNKYDYALFDGGERGLLVSTEDVLWQYDLETGEATEVLRWDEENVCIDGRAVMQINIKEPTEWGNCMDILAYDSRNIAFFVGPMMASITYEDRAALPRRQEISIGIKNDYGNIEQTVRRFNRLNKEYKAVLAEYSASGLQDLLMYGGEVPDLLDVTGIRTGWLESKDLLADLAPYFENSSAIGKGDILESVWELLGKGGKLTSMATSFKIRTLVTAADIPEDGWDYGLFLGLGEQYPGSRYLSTHNAMQVWGTISATGVNDYIDWGGRECSFDSQGFRDLLGRIKNLDYPGHQAGGWKNAEEQMAELVSQQVLFQIADYGSAHGYNKDQTDSGRRIKSVGYPTADGRPMFLFSASQSLAIYGESPNKDGAWAFLEFLLSEGEQGWYGRENDVFPVNAKAFEEYLTRPYGPPMGTGEIIIWDWVMEEFEDTPDRIRYMVQHLGLNQNGADEVHTILMEELQAYFIGDKTVEETTEIIQSRVQNYLDEM